ncbi:MAG TPA: type VI secretion system membrane subunit TssM [Burkholderiales bacterium]|nr:type VI secretion system membrane subunit TssM [Burkholderiales bacterium]
MSMPGWLHKRWLLGALALAALSLTVWFAGDLVAFGAWRPLETEMARGALIAAAAVVWAALEWGRARRARLENERLLEVLAGAGESDSAARAAREIALLRQRFEEAAAVLKTARFKGPDGERRYVHELPWYVFIGAPGSGKTTALVNSGLQFPLRGAGSDPALAGVGGTRNCDWWFTDEAVLLDTAGRYTTQESDLEADAAAWLGFLDLIKRYRPRRPLNGALVTLSISDLMLWSDDERTRYAWHVRARIAELYERLGVRFPVYLLVTKCDLLAGFMEFFGELDADGRARVWGATFDYAADGFVLGGPGHRFSEQFEDLERRLYAELRNRLERESDLQRRAAAYRFPQEFRGIGPLIEKFLDSAFIGVQGAPEPLLRGVYFTSGTQEGSPIDRVLGTLARSFKLERAAGPALAGSGKSFFLRRLLREVIFPESGLAGSDERLERQARRAKAMAFGAIAAVAASAVALWTVSFFGNRDFISVAQARTASAKGELDKLGTPGVGGEAQLVRALNALRDLPGGYRDRQRGVSVASGFGLSQSEKLGAQAVRAYRNALRDALLPRLAGARDDSSKWALSDSERADLAGHVRAMRDEAIMDEARAKPAPAKAP